MSMISLPPAAYRAMAVQSKRLHHEPTLQQIIDDLRVQLAAAERDRAAAQEEIRRLNAENDKLAVLAHGTKKMSKTSAANADSPITGQFHNGIEYVNQLEACALLGMSKSQQYKISRWIKAGKFQMIAVPGHKKPQIVRTSLHKPERGQPGPKKK